MPTTQAVPSLYDELRAKAMELPDKDRAQLAHDLLETLDDEDADLEGDDEINDKWMAEIVRRSDEVREGKVVPLTLEEHLESVRSSMEASRP